MRKSIEILTVFIFKNQISTLDFLVKVHLNFVIDLSKRLLLDLKKKEKIRAKKQVFNRMLKVNK